MTHLVYARARCAAWLQTKNRKVYLLYDLQPALEITGRSWYVDGEFDEAHPYFSQLPLARGEWLSLMEVRRMRLAGPFIFLNACGSGKALQEGGGTLGLADGFLAAGARSVLASLWAVDDRSAVQLAERFYQHLLSEPVAGSPARALALAQRDLLSATDKEGALRPSSWSAFFLIGGPGL